MDRVAVVTDTTHYLPRDLVEALGLHEVSLYVTFEGETDREADITDLDDFYDAPQRVDRDAGHLTAVGRRLPRRLRAAPRRRPGHRVRPPERAASPAPSPPPSRRATSSSSAGSNRGGIVVLDSATACAGLGMMAIAAASAARPGATAEQAAEAARAVRRELKVWFGVDTLEFLRRGGRVGGAQAWLGSTLKIKPILSIESEILPVERVRTSRRTFERLIDYLKNAPRGRLPTRSSSSTSTRPTRRSVWSSAGGRSTAASPSSCPRSAPSSARTWGRGCSGSRGSRGGCCTRAKRPSARRRRRSARGKRRRA